MSDQAEEERILVRALYTSFFRTFLVVVIVCSVFIVALLFFHRELASLAARGQLWFWTIRLGESVFLCGLGIGLAGGLVSWFRRQTYPGDRLPVSYRKVAWSFVAASIAIFMALLWYTLSKGFTKLY